MAKPSLSEQYLDRDGTSLLVKMFLLAGGHHTQSLVPHVRTLKKKLLLEYGRLRIQLHMSSESELFFFTSHDTCVIRLHLPLGIIAPYKTPKKSGAKSSFVLYLVRCQWVGFILNTLWKNPSPWIWDLDTNLQIGPLRIIERLGPRKNSIGPAHSADNPLPGLHSKFKETQKLLCPATF